MSEMRTKVLWKISKRSGYLDESDVIWVWY